jgi:GTP-binding protein
LIHAKFVLSAASASDFPKTGLAEIAMVGRSNVGKSSLINALLSQKVARTSAAPGKTRLVNYYLIQSPIPDPRFPRGFYLVDLPGYGYARGGAESTQAFETLTADYFDPGARADRRVAGVLHLIDARHPQLPQDIDAHSWMLSARLPSAVVAAKIDKLSQSERQKALAQLAVTYDVPILAESALNREGLDDIWKLIRRWIGERV